MSGGGGGTARRELALRALFSASLRPEPMNGDSKECHVSPRSLHLSQGLREIAPHQVTWGPQLNVFQPVTSKMTDWIHKLPIGEWLQCPAIAPAMYYSKPQISEQEFH